MSSLSEAIQQVFSVLRTTPSILRQVLPDMEAKLQSSIGRGLLLPLKEREENIPSLPKAGRGHSSAADIIAQGTGNKVTAQEASFASVLESHGFVFQPKGTVSTTAAVVVAAEAVTATVVAVAAHTLFYNYQVNGSQKSIDFRVLQTDGSGTVLAKIDLDLKHTSTDVFFLNDGWFHKDVVYVVTWNRRTSEFRKKITSEPATFIGLGQDMYTPEEAAMMDELLTIKHKYNTEFKGVGSLCTYIRFANRYKCDKMTPEFTEACFAKVLSLLV